MGCVQPKSKTDGKSTLDIVNARDRQGLDELNKVYKLEKQPECIGNGVFGRVFKCATLDDPTLNVAIKVIEKLPANNLESIRQELAILNMLNHPNIVNHIEDYVDHDNVYIGK